MLIALRFENFPGFQIAERWRELGKSFLYRCGVEGFVQEVIWVSMTKPSTEIMKARYHNPR